MNSTTYYLGGYNIIKIKPINFGTLRGKISHTCSSCINFSVFDSWTQSWVNQKLNDVQKSELKLNDKKILEIQNWTDSKFQNLANLFPNLELAEEFKDLFLNNVSDIEIYSINFSEKDTNLLINDFDENYKASEYNFNNGDFILRKNLMKKTPENPKEKFLGYDLIGVDCDGSFHSIICYNSDEIENKFGLKLNKNGLYDTVNETTEFRDYLTEKIFDPLPAYICKVNKVNK
ncbi:MAG: hypothetical protein K0M63_05010 [Weeksellaceae bacterium]|nr:hypothetical protein [Weeksellaceae bacterium]